MKLSFKLVIVVLFSLSAQASYKLSKSPKAIVCYGEDNQAITLSADKSRIRYMVEGETAGFKKVLKKRTDHSTYIAYETEELVLTLKDRGDNFIYYGDQEPTGVKCEVSRQ